jgi:hypothetical protein
MKSKFTIILLIIALLVALIIPVSSAQALGGEPWELQAASENTTYVSFSKAVEIIGNSVVRGAWTVLGTFTSQHVVDNATATYANGNLTVSGTTTTKELNATDNITVGGSLNVFTINGAVPPTGAFVGTTDTQTLYNKTFDNTTTLFYPKNRLAGVTATQTGFSTAPTNLNNSNNGVWTDNTTIGITNSVSAYAYSGYISYDMGASYDVLIRFKATYSSSYAGAQDVMPTVETSNNNSNWEYLGYRYGDGYITTSLNNSSITLSPPPLNSYCRYIRLSLRNAANVSNLGIGLNEIQAIDFGLQ